MGRSFYEEYEVAQETYLLANDVLGYDISRLCFEGPKEWLEETEYAQLAILTTSIACYRAMREVGSISEPAAVAGHSLGEYSALVCAEAVDFTTALLVVKERAGLMKEIALKVDGGMAAVLGLEEEEVNSICDEVGGELEIANLNCPGQIVVTGKEDSLLKGMEMARARGAKRVVRLAVSGPFHSKYLKEAGSRLKEILEEAEIKPPSIPVVANVSADYVKEPGEIRDSLSRQIFSKVRWEEGMRRLIGDGFKDFIEVGPGKVLSGLLKRIDREVNARNIGNPEDL